MLSANTVDEGRVAGCGRRELGARGLAGLILVPAGLAGYAIFLRERFGDPLVFVRQQSAYWDRELTNPFTTMGKAWHTAGEGTRYVTPIHNRTSRRTLPSSTTYYAWVWELARPLDALHPRGVRRRGSREE